MPPSPAGSKDLLRRRYGRPTFPPGPLAESLRALPVYRASRLVLVGSAPLLKQMRINALLDGKELLMPAPGLRDGFYLLRPFSIPFPQLPHAVTSKGMAHFGRRLATAQLAGLAVELLVGEALAVDGQGMVLGDGQGYFDLSVAILAAAGALAPACRIVAVAAPLPEAERLPAEPWDIRADYLLTPAGVREYGPSPAVPPPIFWERLPPTRIRRVTPLWQLPRRADR